MSASFTLSNAMNEAILTAWREFDKEDEGQTPVKNFLPLCEKLEQLLNKPKGSINSIEAQTYYKEAIPRLEEDTNLSFDKFHFLCSSLLRDLSSPINDTNNTTNTNKNSTNNNKNSNTNNRNNGGHSLATPPLSDDAFPTDNNKNQNTSPKILTLSHSRSKSHNRSKSAISFPLSMSTPIATSDSHFTRISPSPISKTSTMHQYDDTHDNTHDEYIKILKEKDDLLNKSIEGSEEHIASLESEQKSLESQLKLVNKENTKFKKKINDLNNQIIFLEQENSTHLQEATTWRTKYDAEKKSAKAFLDQFSNVNEDLYKKNDEIASLKSDLETKNNIIKSLQQEKEQTIPNLLNEIQALKNNLIDSENKIEELNQIIIRNEEEKFDYESELSSRSRSRSRSVHSNHSDDSMDLITENFAGEIAKQGLLIETLSSCLEPEDDKEKKDIIQDKKLSNIKEGLSKYKLYIDKTFNYCSFNFNLYGIILLSCFLSLLYQMASLYFRKGCITFVEDYPMMISPDQPISLQIPSIFWWENNVPVISGITQAIDNWVRDNTSQIIG